MNSQLGTLGHSLYESHFSKTKLIELRQLVDGIDVRIQ